MARILVVESDPRGRKRMVAQLRRDGHAVAGAEGPLQAVPQIELHRYDLVILRWPMLVNGGTAILDTVRNLRAATTTLAVVADEPPALAAPRPPCRRTTGKWLD